MTSGNQLQGSECGKGEQMRGRESHVGRGSSYTGGQCRAREGTPGPTEGLHRDGLGIPSVRLHGRIEARVQLDSYYKPPGE